MVGSNRRNFISSLALGASSLGIRLSGAAESGNNDAANGAGKASKETPRPGPLPLLDLGPAGIAKKFWIDPKIAALPPGQLEENLAGFSQLAVHPHASARSSTRMSGAIACRPPTSTPSWYLPRICTAISTIPAAYGPVHRGLTLDLLGAQVAACRKRNIHVRAYYCTTWDNYLAENHPEWLVFKRDRTTYLPAFDATPHWTALCLAHEDFVALMLSHIKEFTSRYELDGVSLDMPVPIDGECFCAECLRQLRAKNLDPFDKAVQHDHKNALHKAFISKVHDTVKAARPNCQVDFNGQCVYGLGERVAFMDSLDIEALPTAFWGYYYFPTIVRYTRNFGVPDLWPDGPVRRLTGETSAA